MNAWAADLLAVARRAGHPRFLYFGYSFTGAFGPWLALKLREHDAVAAVVSGGFPLLGDYGVTSRNVDTQLAHLEKHPETLVQWEGKFDPRAGAAFYRDLATLAPNSLVNDVPCSLYCFWGDRDSDAVERVMPHSALAAGLSHRGVPWKQLPGYDHEGLMRDVLAAWPSAEEWLLSQAHTLDP